MREQSWTLSSILLYLLLGTAVLLPAEMHASGLVIQAALSGGLFWLLLRQPSPVPAQAYLGIPILAAAALLPSTLLSSQRHTSEAVLFHLFPAVAACVGATCRPRRAIRLCSSDVSKSTATRVPCASTGSRAH